MKFPSPEDSNNSFYHLTNLPSSPGVCCGTACFVARHLNSTRWQQVSAQESRIHCLGKCYSAPSSLEDDSRPVIAVHAPETILLKNLIAGGVRNLDEFLKNQGFLALEKSFQLLPEDLIKLVELSHLRGRGGAGFPTGNKMRSVYQQKSNPKYLIANADEGDPGSYIDRFLMEDDPYRLIESMLITAYAIQAEKGYIYLRKEYPKAYTIVKQSLTEARQKGFLGTHIMGTDFNFDIELIVGLGSYVCGEETALIRSIEGKRPEVMPRPPYPTESGLFGKPTLVLNVETLFNIPWIIQNSSEKYQALGFNRSRGTKAISLNSLFNQPGIYEVEFGIPLRKIVEELGGGLKNGRLKGIMLAGPMGAILPPEKFDTPLGYEELRQIGANLGHGGLIAIDENTSIPELLHHIFEYAEYESCGKCTPCREGSHHLEQLFNQILQNRYSFKIDQMEFTDIVNALAKNSLCGLGTGLAEIMNSTLRYYSKDMEQCFQ